MFAQRRHGDVEIPVRLGIRACEAVCDGVHLGAGALEADAGLQPRDRPEVVAAAMLEVVRPHRDPEIDRHDVLPGHGGRKGERRGHHAGDRVGGAVNRQAAPDRGWIAAELPQPQRVADHRDPRLARAVLALDERTPEQRRDAKHGKQPIGHFERDGALRLLAADHRDHLEPVRGHVLEDAAAALPVAEVRERHPVGLPALAFPRLVELHEVVGLPVIERSQHDGVHEAEHGGRHADAEGERQHDRQREPGMVTEHPERVPQVAPRVLEPGERSGVALRVLRRLDAEERPAGCGAHLVVGEPLPAQIVLEEIAMGRDLARELVLRPSRSEERQDTLREAPDGRHGFTSPTSSLSTRPARRRQRSVSFSSAFSPAFVIA